MSYLNPLHPSITATPTSTPPQTAADWHVLLLWADDSETDLRGIWGPYSSTDTAVSALDELRQWPLDGRWDVRRLNKFVALKAPAGNTDSLVRFTWQS